ncbi:MAG: UDP-N-acetylglucosamine 2-epimerase (non-hydrolyzing) [bacterium]
MKKLKICSIFGTRPEAVKMAPVVLKLIAEDWCEHRLIVTAQHRTMLDQMLTIFSLTPDYDLDIMQENQSLTHVTTSALEKLEGLLKAEKPDLVLVHGDTTTSFASALAAFYSRIPVGHVEAGLRTGDLYNPYPEEMNRRLTDSFSELLLAPTQVAKDDLLKENHRSENIYVTGNTVVDALMIAEKKAMPDDADFRLPDGARELLVEAHRRENWGEPLRNICLALREIVSAYPDVHVVFPVHLNPNVRNTVYELLDGSDRIHLLHPQTYLSFIYYMKRSYIILTDSGGVQEEAPSLKKPVLVLRTKTERPEAIWAKTALLVGTQQEDIIKEVRRLLDDDDAYSEMTHGRNPYGDGRAAQRVVDSVLHHFGLCSERPTDFETGIERKK